LFLAPQVVCREFLDSLERSGRRVDDATLLAVVTDRRKLHDVQNSERRRQAAIDAEVAVELCPNVRQEHR